MTIEDRISGKTSDQLAQILIDLEKERNAIENNNDTIDNEVSRLDREILILRGRKKDLEDTARIGKKLVRDKRLDEKITTRAFWASRRNGSI